MRARKFITLALAGTMLLSAMGVPALAANYDSVIDTNKTGSITVTKLVSLDGTYDNDPSGLTTDAYDGNDQIPVNDIGFHYKQIGTYVSVAGNVVNGSANQEGASGAIVGTYFTALDEGIFGTGAGSVAKKALGNAYTGVAGTTLDNGTPADTSDDVTYYSLKDVEDVIIAINNALGNVPGEENLNSYLRDNGTAMTKTNASGTTTKADLPLGLYLVAETDISAHDGIKADGSAYELKDGTHNPEEIVTKTGVKTNRVLDTLTSPMLVSIPFTNVKPLTEGSTTHAAGTVWMYDPHLYPKNQVNTVVKRIITGGDANTPVADGKLVTRNDYEIGDTVKQVVFADCPRLYQGNTADALHENVNAKKHERYIISDKMSNGLTLQSATIRVAYGDKAAAIQTDVSDFSAFTDLAKNTDYRVYTKVAMDGASTFATWASDPNVNAGAYAQPWTDAEKTAVQDATFFIQLTEDGLNKINALTKDSTIAVFFDCTLNKNAVTGVTEANTNHPALAWKNTSNSMRRVEGNHVYDFTYQLDLTKKGITDFSQVRFTVTGVDKDGDPTSLVSFIKESDGVYHVFDNDTDAAANKVTELSPSNTQGSKGLLTVKGLDSESYIVKEISTQDHRQLLKSTFTVLLKSNGSADTNNANALDVFVENTGVAGSYRLMTGALGTATATTSDNLTANLDLKSDNAGIAEIEVENIPTREPATGGIGRNGIYLFGGMGLMAFIVLAGAGMVLLCRRSDF